MKAKEWIYLYGLEHYAKHNLRKGGRRGRELDYALVRKYRKRYGVDIPLKPPRRYYYAIWNFDYSYYDKLTGEEKFDRIENCKSVLREWEKLRANRKEELLLNQQETFDALRFNHVIPYDSVLEKAELVRIETVIQRSLKDYEIEEEIKPKPEPKLEPELKPAPELVIKKERPEREIELRERELQLREREMQLRERKLSMAEKFLEKGYSPKEIKELLDAI